MQTVINFLWFSSPAPVPVFNANVLLPVIVWNSAFFHFIKWIIIMEAKWTQSGGKYFKVSPNELPVYQAWSDVWLSNQPGGIVHEQEFPGNFNRNDLNKLQILHLIVLNLKTFVQTLSVSSSLPLSHNHQTTKRNYSPLPKPKPIPDGVCTD